MAEDIIKIDINKHFEDAVTAASELFMAGEIFIYPTATIYGFGGNPFKSETVERINTIKGREKAKQFIWLLADMEKLLNYVELDSEKKLDFLIKIYPGPVSVILNLNARSKELVGYETVAFRIPDNPFCNKLLNEIRLPLISTSVNRSGSVVINDYDQIIKEFSKDVDAIFYSTKKSSPSASTIIDFSGEKPFLVREGTIKFVDLLDKFN